MNKSFSIYLDIIRFMAACLVVLYHSNMRNIVETILPASNWGHAAVIVFFVLSGFVIAYITDTKENTLKEYSASRLTRVYSLAIPAVILTVVLDHFGEPLGQDFYSGKTTHDYGVFRAVSSLLFMNEVWSISITSFSNVPYWSLCYEMWYYVLFAIWAFARGRQRLFLLAGACLIVGHKILLLAPIWLMGVALYRWEAPKRMGEPAAWAALLLSSLGIFLWQWYQLTDFFTDQLKLAIGAEAHKQLAFSKFFIGDYFLGILVMANFAAFRRLSEYFAGLMGLVEKPVKFLAGFTFSIYIFHQPLILFWAAIINWSPKGYGFYAAVMGATFGTIFLLGWLIERRRFQFRKLLHGWMTGLEGRFSGLAKVFAQPARY